MKKIISDWHKAYLSLQDPLLISPTHQKIILGGIVIICLVIRVLIIDAPAIDRTVWKEIDYIMISKNFWQHGFRFLYPEIWWPAESPRFTAMELPLVPFLTAIGYSLFGFHVYSIRFLPVLGYLLLAVYIFRLVKRESGPLSGILASLCSVVLPLHHPFRNYLFSEPLMIPLSVMALFHFAQWIDYNRRKDFIFAVITFSLAISLKLTPLYLLLPLFYIAWREYGLNWSRYKSFFALIVISLILPILWYAWAYHLAGNYIDVFGVVPGKGHDKMQTITMLSRSDWYKTIFERILWQILGGKIGLLFVFIGCSITILNRRGGLFYAYLAAILAFFCIVAEGQLDASYRQLSIVPVLSFFISQGAIALIAVIWPILSRFKRISEIKSIGLVPLVGGLLLVLLIPLKSFSTIVGKRPDVAATPAKWEFAQIIKQYTSETSTLIAAGEYSIHKGGKDLSPVLYYYSGLQGWTLQDYQWDLGAIQELKLRGGTHFAAIDMNRHPESANFIQQMKKKYRVLYEDNLFLLLEL